MRRDRYIKEAVNRVMREILTEASCKIPRNSIIKWVEDYNKKFKPEEPFTHRQASNGGWNFTFRYKGRKPETVNGHFSHKGVHMAKGRTLIHIKHALERLGWFDSEEHFNFFPWQKWGLTPNDDDLEIDNEEAEIEQANDDFSDAETQTIFSNNDLCVLSIEVTDDKLGEMNLFNLCRSDDDRRPLLDDWYNFYDYKNGRPCLGDEDYETGDGVYYPINPDGTLDKNGVIKENKRYYGRKRLF